MVLWTPYFSKNEGVQFTMMRFKSTMMEIWPWGQYHIVYWTRGQNTINGILNMGSIFHWLKIPYRHRYKGMTFYHLITVTSSFHFLFNPIDFIRYHIPSNLCLSLNRNKLFPCIKLTWLKKKISSLCCSFYLALSQITQRLGYSKVQSLIISTPTQQGAVVVVIAW